MQAHERRFRQRYSAAPLKLEFRRINWFGRPKKPHPAIARDFAIGGLSMLSTAKLKQGQRILLSLESSDHRLQSVPALVIRAEAQGDEYLYALKFSLGDLPESVSRSAYNVLQRLELSLKSARAA